MDKKQEERFEHMKRTLNEAEQSGIETLEELQRQREKINHCRDSLQQAENNIDKSAGILKTMTNRQFWMKVVTLSFF